MESSGVEVKMTTCQEGKEAVHNGREARLDLRVLNTEDFKDW